MNHVIWTNGHELIIEDIIVADNCDLFDINGKKFIDMESGVWCTSLGHGHPRINNAIRSQISKISHTGFNYCNPIIEIAAQKVLEVTELTNGKCEFLSSGSEAVEFCVRLAKTLTPGKKILTFSDSYFGAYGDAAAKENNEIFKFNWMTCSCNAEADGCQAECDEFAAIPFEQIGIFLFEPGSSSGMVRFPSEKIIQKIVQRIRENNGIVIINEVTTGVGRTGKWFGFQHYNIKPDMIAIGKGIGNGYPVSVAVVSEWVVMLLGNTPFLYSQSHQNDPLGAAVVKEVIDTISDDNLIKCSHNLGEKFRQELNQLKSEHSIIKEIRGRGLMIVIEFTKDAKFIQSELLNRGFIVAKRSGHEVLRLDPALTIEKKNLEVFIDELTNIIKTL